MGAEVVIPPKSNRKDARSFDKDLYKERNMIERMFNKLKHFRRVATRYDKTASAYLAFVLLAAMLFMAQIINCRQNLATCGEQSS